MNSGKDWNKQIPRQQINKEAIRKMTNASHDALMGTMKIKMQYRRETPLERAFCLCPYRSISSGLCRRAKNGHHLQQRCSRRQMRHKWQLSTQTVCNLQRQKRFFLRIFYDCMSRQTRLYFLGRQMFVRQEICGNWTHRDRNEWRNGMVPPCRYLSRFIWISQNPTDKSNKEPPSSINRCLFPVAFALLFATLQASASLCLV